MATQSSSEDVHMASGETIDQLTARAKDALIDLDHPKVKWVAPENNGSKNWWLKVATWTVDDLQGSKRDVFFSMSHTRNSSRLYYIDDESREVSLPKDAFKKDCTRFHYPFHNIRGERNIRTVLNCVGRLLLMTKNVGSASKWPATEGELKKHKKTWKEPEIFDKIVQGQQPTDRDDREPLTKLEREMQKEGGLITFNSMPTRFGGGSSLPLAFKLEDQRRGPYARILDPTLDPADRNKRPDLVIQIRGYLAILQNPRLDPRFFLQGRISHNTVRRWVNYVLDSRVMIWIWEYAVYVNIRKMLQSISMNVRNVDGERTKTSELSEIIRLKKLSLSTGTPIPITAFFEHKTKFSFYKPEDWVRTRRGLREEEVQAEKSAVETIEEGNAEEVDVRALRMLKEQILTPDAHFGRTKALNDFEDKCLQHAWNERGKYDIDTLKRVFQMEHAAVSVEEAAFAEINIFKAVPAVLPRGMAVQEIGEGMFGDLPGNPYWVVRQQQKGEAESRIKQLLEEVPWDELTMTIDVIEKVEKHAALYCN